MTKARELADLAGSSGGGIDVEADRLNQVIQSIEGAEGFDWSAGMAFDVVDTVPSDSDGDVGDVVFVTQPGALSEGEAAPAPGLVHIHTQSWTDAASVRIDSVFSSTFDRYKVLLSTNQTDVGQIWGQFRTGDTLDNNTSSYNNHYLDAYSTGSDSGSTNTSGCLFSYRSGSGISNCESTFYNPASGPLQVYTCGIGANGNALAVQHRSSTYSGSCDGMDLFPAAGTFSGSISIYGYSKGA